MCELGFTQTMDHDMALTPYVFTVTEQLLIVIKSVKINHMSTEKDSQFFHLSFIIT